MTTLLDAARAVLAVCEHGPHECSCQAKAEDSLRAAIAEAEKSAPCPLSNDAILHFFCGHSARFSNVVWDKREANGKPAIGAVCGHLVGVGQPLCYAALVSITSAEKGPVSCEGGVSIEGGMSVLLKTAHGHPVRVVGECFSINTLAETAGLVTEGEILEEVHHHLGTTDEPCAREVWCARDIADIVAKRTAAIVEKARRDGACDACAGTGESISGAPCMCGGTGRAVDAVVYLRELLASKQAEAKNAGPVTAVEVRAIFGCKVSGEECARVAALCAERTAAVVERTRAEERQAMDWPTSIRSEMLAKWICEVVEAPPSEKGAAYSQVLKEYRGIIEQAQAEVREMCARIADKEAARWDGEREEDRLGPAMDAAENIATAIRAGETP